MDSSRSILRPKRILSSGKTKMLGNNKNNKNNNNFEYISLQDATKFCNYSQEYLSLRARTGKLKSVKLGRNWVTTREWLVDYAGRVEEYNESINNNHEKEKIARTEISRSVKDQIFHSPPENLPILRSPKIKLNFGTLRPGFAAALVLILITAGGVFGKESFLKTYNDVARVAQNFVRNMETVCDDVFTATVDYKSALISASSNLIDYSQRFKESYLAVDKSLEHKIGKTLLSLAPEKAEQKIGGALLKTKNNYSLADQIIEQKISGTLLFLGDGTRTVLGQIKEQFSDVGDFANNFVKQKLVEAGNNL